MKIGIIGAENSHSEAIAKAINIDKLISGCSVEYLWGETRELAEKTARNGNIPVIVDDSLNMLDKVDAVIVDHRHPRYHLPAVLPFIEKGIPTFVDKPFCYRTDEGISFLAAARKYKTPVTSFSVLPKQESYKTFFNKLSTLGEIKSGALFGACDLESEYGGIFFYGIHQIEPALKSFGYNVSAVQLIRNNKNGTALLFYENNLIISLNLINKGCPGFSITAIGEKGSTHQNLTYDSNIYLSGIKTFTEMFKTRIEPESYGNILKPVQILEALEQSLNNNGKIIPINPLNI